MSLTNMYFVNIEQMKKGNMELYDSIILEVFGKKVPWSKIKEIKDRQGEDRHLITQVYAKLDNAIKLKNSVIHVEVLARAIQDSRSGIGGCAMTNFDCKFCGEIEMWSNTATPGICHKCAKKMAINIAKYYGSSIIKKGE